MDPLKITSNNPLDEIYRKIVLEEETGKTLLKEGSTKLVQHLASGHPVSALLAETVGPVYVDATIEEIPRYVDDYSRFQKGESPAEVNRPGEYYVDTMNSFFDKFLTKPLGSVLPWLKDLLKRDAERASSFLHR